MAGTITSTGTLIRQVNKTITGIISSILGALTNVKITPPATLTLSVTSRTTLTMSTVSTG